MENYKNNINMAMERQQNRRTSGWSRKIPIISESNQPRKNAAPGIDRYTHTHTFYYVLHRKCSMRKIWFRTQRQVLVDVVVGEVIGLIQSQQNSNRMKTTLIPYLCHFSTFRLSWTSRTESKNVLLLFSESTTWC